ncbi:hypothetical protein HAX54_034270 [Datura stramonium]|uniref:Uncharacterized protein n=1 Tax=Datura stramonium TaxID=4076 RepID=A0ABS8VEG6_DATST|nr:hypothetical protein [Datura stramonium]
MAAVTIEEEDEAVAVVFWSEFGRVLLKNGECWQWVVFRWVLIGSGRGGRLGGVGVREGDERRAAALVFSGHVGAKKAEGRKSDAALAS